MEHPATSQKMTLTLSDFFIKKKHKPSLVFWFCFRTSKPKNFLNLFLYFFPIFSLDVQKKIVS